MRLKRIKKLWPAREKTTRQNSGKTPSELVLSEQEAIETFTKTKPKPYQLTTIKELLTELGGRDVALWLPTGTGKTYVYLPVAIAAANKGYRVCILVATNLIMGQMKQKYFPNFGTNIEPYYAKGIEHYKCLLTVDSADYGTCTLEQRTLCQADNPDCMVLHTNRQLEEHGFVITNFHKFLSVPTKRGFDLIVVDDSHGFENALDDKFQSRIAYYQIDGLYRRHQSLNDAISNFAGTFLDLFDNILGAVSPDQLTRRIPDDDVKKMAGIEGYDEVLIQMKDLDKLDRSASYGLLYFIRSCQKATLNTFYVQKDYYNRDDPQEAALIARKSDAFQHNVITSLFGESRVLFVSATPGDIVTHANYCTHRRYGKDTISVIPRTPPAALKNWFKGLRIFETQDFPEDVEDPIERSAEIVAEMLTRIPGKILLLFKNYRDQRRAEGILKRLVTREITFIDDSYETETVQTLVDKADVIMATASSRLWEGIDISDLKLDIVFSLPFIRPPVYLDSSKSFPFVKRKMLIRLQQGIGRLVRKEGDRGVCVIFDKRLEKYKSSSNFSEAYRERIKLTNIAKVSREVERAIGVV